MTHHHNVWLISVPNWALLSLPLRFRAEQSFLGVSDEPLHSRCLLQGLICDPQGVASRNEDQQYTGHIFKKCLPQLLLMIKKWIVYNQD